jgi:hypothetical protein
MGGIVAWFRKPELLRFEVVKAYTYTLYICVSVLVAEQDALPLVE